MLTLLLEDHLHNPVAVAALDCGIIALRRCVAVSSQ
jgi:hypothetical protein